MVIRLFTTDEWNRVKDAALESCFGSADIATTHSYSFTLVAEQDGSIMSFIQVLELSQSKAYITWGGVLPSSRHKQSPEILKQYIDFLLKKYATISMHAVVTNSPMIIVALKAGFIPAGTSTNNGNLLIELQIER